MNERDIQKTYDTHASRIKSMGNSSEAGGKKIRKKKSQARFVYGSHSARALIEESMTRRRNVVTTNEGAMET